MLKLKKKIQKYFKSIGYILFKILYGKVEDVIDPNKQNDISTELVKIDNKFLYKFYKVENGRLYTDRINNTAIIKNNKIVEGPSFQYRTLNSEIINAVARENIVLVNGTPRLQKKIKGTVLSLLTGGAGNDNYWHWIFDVLPRLAICEKKINLSSIDYFLLPDNKKKFQTESLKELGIPKEKQISSIDYRHIIADNLYITTHPVVLSENATQDIQNIPEWISPWLKEKFLKNKPKKEKKIPKKIYLDRSDSKSNVKNLRSVTNENEVKKYLSDKGFEMIKLTELYFKDQALTFNNADVIVGLHGAGFANVAFCKPNTKIIEISANPLDNVIKSLSLKNNLDHKTLSNENNITIQQNQFGHIKVSIDQLNRIIQL